MKSLGFTPLVSVVTVAAGCACFTSAHAGPYSSIYFFGDSVSDSGNVALAISQPSGVPQSVTGNGYIPDFPYYPSGRFSNGPVWAEDFAAKYGLAAAPSLAGGTDFAFAGARTGGPNVPVPTLTTQAGLFLAGTGGSAPTDALYVIAEVGNDARDALAAIGAGADAKQTIELASAAYALHLGSLIDTLRSAGASEFLVFDNVNLGLVPAITSLGTDASALASAVTSNMNAALLQRIDAEPGVRVFDTYSFLTRVVQSPESYGFSNATDACGAVAAADCSSYVFWDGLHPTAAMHALIATAAVPEPQSPALVALGLAWLAWCQRRRRMGARAAASWVGPIVPPRESEPHMHQLTPSASRAPITPTRFRHVWLAPIALAACELALAGLPAATAPASLPLRAAAQTAAYGAATASASPDTLHQTWQGSTYDDLVAGWTRWLLSIPLGVNPLAATETGVNCAINQSGPVWYLAAPGGVTYTRSCTLPVGKVLVMPVASYIDDYPCPPAFGFQPPPQQSLEDFLRADAMSIMDGTTAHATLDNKPLRVKRVTTGIFSFTAAASLAALGDACLTASPQLAVSDGLFLFIEPLTPGTHTLQVNSTNQYFGTTTGTFTLIVKK